MSSSFFLTRQSANLMEDFVRELDARAGLYLIYGDEGVGKTRLLAEIAGKQLSERKIHWMDLKAGNAAEGVLVDSSPLIENTFASAEPGDVIVADHFEMALKKTRHQLFLSWSTDGVDKNLNLIIAASSDYINELRQLAQQYQVSLQSFQQLPLNPDETIAFLGFYLFPDRPFGELVIPQLLRTQLATAQGNVGNIIEIAERAGDQISSAPINDSEAIRQGSRSVVGVTVAAALVLMLGWAYIGREESEPAPPLQLVAQPQPAAAVASLENEPDPTALASGPGANTAAVEAAAEVVAQGVVETAPLQAKQGESNETGDVAPSEALAALTEAVPETGGEAVDETVVDAPDEATDDSKLDVDPPVQAVEMPAAAGDSEPRTEVIVTATEEVAPVAEPVNQAGWGSARLRQDLQVSLDWIAARAGQTGTLQIMMLSRSKFDEQVYYAHLEQLASKGVDLARVRIFEAYTGNRAVLSVVYDEYPSRAAANDAKPGLPPVLRKAKPIARSIDGLLEEIQRLREQN